MAIDFVCGWECQSALTGAAAVTPDEQHWDSPASSTVLTISTTTVRSGLAALRCNAVGVADSVGKTVARTIVAARLYVRWASFPASNSGFIRFIDASGNASVQVTTGGVVTAVVGTGSATATIVTASTGIWYRFDVLFDASGATASLKVRADGGTETNATNVQTSANCTQVKFGNTGSTTMDVFFDDLLLGDASGDYPFGAGTVERLKPTRDGTHSFTAADFGYNTAGADVATSATDVWSFLDEDDMTSTADLIRQKAINAAGYVEIGFGSAPLGQAALALNVVTAWHAASTTADTMGAKLNDNGTIKTLTDEAGDGLSDFSQTTICYAEKVLTTAPSGGAWTSTKLGAVLFRAGYSGDVTPNPYIDSLVLEIAYGPVVAFVPYRNPMPPLIAQ